MPKNHRKPAGESDCPFQPPHYRGARPSAGPGAAGGGGETDSCRIARLEREVEDLRSANEILRSVAGYLASPARSPFTRADHFGLDAVDNEELPQGRLDSSQG